MRPVFVEWPLPYEHEPNDFEIVGRYIAQTIQMERFVDLILLHEGQRPEDLVKQRMSAKIKSVGRRIRADPELASWSDLPRLMAKVNNQRNDFAHAMFLRGALPAHYSPQRLQYEVLSREDLKEQEKEAYFATELCRQLVGPICDGHLNPHIVFEAQMPAWPPPSILRTLRVSRGLARYARSHRRPARGTYPVGPVWTGVVDPGGFRRRWPRRTPPKRFWPPN